MPAARSAAAALRPVAAPLAAAGLLVGLLAWGWSGLWEDPPGWRLALVGAAGIMPALVRACGARRAALWSGLSAAAAAVVALGAAVASNPVAVVTGDGPTWSRLGDILPTGLGDAASVALPLSGARAEPLAALLLLVLGGAATVIAWQAMVSGRPLGAVITAAVGLAYRWTLVPPERPVLAGTATLIVALAALRLAVPRRLTPAIAFPGRAVVIAVAVGALAVGGSISAGQNTNSWWNWESWTFGTGGGPTRLDVSQQYGPLDYPDEPVVLARVQADEPVPLRAVTLAAFDGVAFSQAATGTLRVATSGELVLDPDRSGGTRRITQRVSLVGARTEWVFMGGRAGKVRGIGARTASLFDDGSARVQPPVGPNATYEVDTLVPDPGPGALLAARPYGQIDDALLTMFPGQGLPAVTVPPWGSGGPAPAPQAFGPYADVYRLSRRVIGRARTPYEAVNAIETLLRSSAYAYDETAPRPVGTPDLVDFLQVSKRGYCQHFAGAMALMLRMNGVPARVAVGLTSDAGRFDPDTSSYAILDRDAHSWVEVQFPGFGWLPFDPTPGRSVPNIASVSSPEYTTEGIDVTEAANLNPEPVAPGPPLDPQRNEPAFPEGSASSRDAGPGAWWLLALPALALMALAAIPATKAIRRARRRRGDERAQVLGATRELESFALDAGVPVDPALTPTERAEALEGALGVNTRRLYGHASTARFAPSPPAEGAGREAWADVRRARRSLGVGRRLRASLRMRSLRGDGT